MDNKINILNRLWIVGIALACLSTASLGSGQVVSNSTEAAEIDYFQPAIFRTLPDGEALLQKVRSQLPAVPLMLRADIKTLTRGASDHLLKSEVELHWDAPEPNARYTIMDGFGSLVERLEVTWSPVGPSRYRHFSGEDATPSNAFDLYASIQSAPLTWFDLSLPFLWWPGGETVGVDRRKGRDCYLVDIPAPDWEPSPYRRMRIWVDAKAYLVLHAEAYGPEDELHKTIKIQSLKKINDVWMVKNLEVVHAPTKTRTKILVQELDLLSRARTVEPTQDMDELTPLLP